MDGPGLFSISKQPEKIVVLIETFSRALHTTDAKKSIVEDPSISFEKIRNGNNEYLLL